MNWLGILIIAGFVVLIVVINIGLVNLLRGRPNKPPLWLDLGRTWQHGQQARQRQQNDLDELRRRVEELKKG